MPLALLAKKCVYCLRPYHLGDTKIVSLRTGEVLYEPPAAGIGHYMSRVYVHPLVETRFPGMQPRRVCPNCDKILPTSTEDVDSKVIAVIGATNVGKSHFIAILIEQLLRTSALADVGCEPLFPEAETESEYIAKYADPLLNRKEELLNTPGSLQSVGRPGLARPLIFHVNRKRGNSPRSTGVDLVFFDAAGEDLTNQNTMELYDPYIASASGIIFLIDPLQIETIRAQVHPSKLLNVKVNMSEIDHPASIIGRVRACFRQQQGPTSKIKVPTAFVLSKSDMLSPSASTTPLLSRYSPIFKASVHRGGYDVEDGIQVSNEVATLLKETGAGIIVSTASIFEPHAFFAVSATGGPPDSTHHFSSIAPLRVLDPLFWLLAQLKVIDEVPAGRKASGIKREAPSSYAWSTPPATLGQEDLGVSDSLGSRRSLSHPAVGRPRPRLSRRRLSLPTVRHSSRMIPAARACASDSGKRETRSWRRR